MLIIVFLFFLSFFSSEGLADSLLQDIDCNIPGKSNSDTGKGLQVFMGSKGLICDKNCTKIFTNEAPITKNNINQDLLLSCLDLCQEKINTEKDYTFSANKKKFVSGTITKTMTDPISQIVRSNNFNYYNIEYDARPISVTLPKNQKESYSNFSIGSATKVTIKLNNKVDNTIYTCGAKTITLTPLFPNLYKMAPGSLFDGNASQIALNFDKAGKNPLEDKNYTSLQNFPYERYISLFGSTGNLQEDLSNLTCNFYKSLVASGEEKGTCLNFVNKIGLKTSWCNGCNKPDDNEQKKFKLLAGSIKCNDEINGKSLQSLCNSFNLDPSNPFLFPTNLKEDLKFYNEISQVQLGEGTFFRSGWSNSNKEGNWDQTDRKYHPCLISNEIINGKLDNKSLTSLTTISDPEATNINLKNNPSSVGCYPNWHIYQGEALDLGINISDGDYLSLSWTGNFILGNGLTVPFLDQGKAKLLTLGIINAKKLNFKPRELLDWISTITFQGLKPLVGETGKNNNLNGNFDSLSSDNCMVNINKKLSELDQKQISNWYGLEGSITRQNFFFKDSQCNSSIAQNDRYIFNGEVKGIGQKFPLKVNPFFFDRKLANLFKESIITGGQQLIIDWKGCPIKNGEKLQMAFAENLDEAPKEWFSVNAKNLQDGFTLTRENSTDKEAINKMIPSQAKFLLFRILDTQATKAQGSYEIIVEPTFSQTTAEWSKLIPKQIFQTLIGNPDQVNNNSDLMKLDGILVKLTNVMQKQFIPIAQVTLVIFFILNAFGFMLGTIRTTQQEFIFRIIKVSFVGLLLSETTWTWFIENFIRLFIIGPLWLAFQVQNYFNNSLKIPQYTDLFDLFSIIRIFDFILQKDLWIKIGSLVLSSLGGLVLAIIVIVILIMVLKMMIDSLLVFFSSLITQGILLLVSPFFILLKLFENTKDLFDAWAKQVIAFALIPTIVILATSIGNLIIMNLLQALMGFSYCKVPITILGIPIGGLYKPLLLSSMHSPADTSFFLPMTIAVSALALVIVASLVWNIVKLAVGMTTRIITFKIQTMGQESMSGIASSTISPLYNPDAIGRGFEQGLERGGIKGGLMGALGGFIPALGQNINQEIKSSSEAEKYQVARKEFKEFKKEFDKIKD